MEERLSAIFTMEPFDLFVDDDDVIFQMRFAFKAAFTQMTRELLIVLALGHALAA